MSIGELRHKIVCFLSPIKFSAWGIMLLAFFSNLANPFFHYVGGPNGTPFTPIPEYVLKAIFFFCGAFALLGNGKTIKARLTAVLIPNYYLATLYTMKFIQTGTESLILPMITLITTSLWLLIVGEHYESTDRKCPSFIDSYIDWLSAKLNYKTYRKG
jgi:hypothetical protein